MSNNVLYRFVFVGSPRRLRPLPGGTGGESSTYVMRSIPGNLVAWADTPDAAESKLKRLLEAGFDRSGDVEKWYDRAFSRLSPRDRRIGSTVWGRSFGSKAEQKTLRDGAVFMSTTEAELAGKP